MTMSQADNKWIRRFVITETSRHKKGFTIYKVTSMVFLKTSPEISSKVSVWKRYNDFKKLHKLLYNSYKTSVIDETYPPFIKSKIFGRFEKQVVIERREWAVKFLDFVAKHNSLYTNEIFVKFFETSLTNNESSSSITTYSQLQGINSPDTSEDDNDEDILTKSMEDFPISTCTSKPKIYNNTCNHQCKSYSDDSSNDIKIQEYEVNSTKSDSCIELRAREISMLDNAELNKGIANFNRHYILVAAAHMSAGYKHEALGENKEAYIQYKLGIAQLKHGMLYDPSQSWQSKILDKIQMYSERADKLQNKYSINCFDVSLLCKPVTHLESYKILKIIGSVLLVKDTQLHVERVIKTVEKQTDDNEDINNYILQRKVPFMVHLDVFIQTETTIFLILEYAAGGKLWDYLKFQYGIPNKTLNSTRNLHLSKSYSDLSRIHHIQQVSANVSSVQEYIEENVNSMILKNDLPISQLLENSHRLLKSVDETLKKSNSVASKLNDSANWPHEFNKTNKFKNTQHYESTNEQSSFPNHDKFNLSSKNINIAEYLNTQFTCINSSVSRSESYTEKSIDAKIYHRQYWIVPEIIIKRWAAQLISALQVLHEQNIVVSNLHPDNLLINSSNDIALSYILSQQHNEIMSFRMPYSAPELCMYLPTVAADPAVDIWSFGIILYELLTGIPFQARHKGFFHSHSIISIPNDLSEDAKSLLLNIIKYEPSQRISIIEIKNHPFFAKIDWFKISKY